MFFSGDGRYGKLNLTKKCFYSSNKLFYYQSEDPNKPRIVVLASAGVVTVNINGTIIHFWLIIPCKGKFVSIKWWNCAGNKYSEVDLVIIDEISMVSDVSNAQTFQWYLVP